MKIFQEFNSFNPEIQVLSRRTKSNPVVGSTSTTFLSSAHSIIQLIGPPGVGKTAILEGLASRIISKEVPEVRLTGRFLGSSTNEPSFSLSKINVYSRLTSLRSWLVLGFEANLKRNSRPYCETLKKRYAETPFFWAYQI